MLLKLVKPVKHPSAKLGGFDMKDQATAKGREKEPVRARGSLFDPLAGFPDGSLFCHQWAVQKDAS